MSCYVYILMELTLMLISLNVDLVDVVSWYHCVQDEQTQVCGVVVIKNMTDLGVVQARNIKHRAVKLWFSLLQVALPILRHHIV